MGRERGRYREVETRQTDRETAIQRYKETEIER